MFSNLLSFAEEAEQTAEVKVFSSEWWNSLWSDVSKWITTSGVRLLISVVILIISFKIINGVAKRTFKRMQKHNVDQTVAKVTYSGIKIGLKLLIAVCLVSYVGVDTAAISGFIAAVSLGLSMAVQGTLANFAGGILLIVTRPFSIGDYISSGSYEGVVEDIRLFYTHIVTFDNQAIMIPNGTLSNNTIVNYSKKNIRRVDMVASVAYGTDVDKAKSVIASVCEHSDIILKTPAPFIRLTAMGSNSLDITVRAWCDTANYWDVKYYLVEAIKKAFDQNGIVIPFNQLDVHLDSNEKHEEDLPEPKEQNEEQK